MSTNESLAVRFVILRLQCFGFVVLRFAIAIVLFDLTVSEKIVEFDESLTEIIACPDEKPLDERVITNESERKVRRLLLLSEN